MEWCKANPVRVGTVLLVLGVCAGLLRTWWVQPNPAWACEKDDVSSGCIRSVQLDLGPEVYGNNDRLERGARVRSGDVSNDGETMAAWLAQHEEGSLSGYSLVLFDLTTGSIKRTLVSVDNNSQFNVRFSPDSSLVIAGYWEGDAKNPSVQLFGVESEDQHGPFELEKEECDVGVVFPLGASEDNTQFQCRKSVYEVETGEKQSEIDPDSGGANALVASHYLRSRDHEFSVPLGEDVVIRCRTDCWRKEVAEEDVVFRLGEDFRFNSFDPSSSLILTLRGGRSESSEPYRWSPTNTFEVIRFSDGKVIRSIQTKKFAFDSPFVKHEWSEQENKLMMFTTGGEVAVFDVSEQPLQ